jgi:FkbM family methyltransferase
MTPFVDPSPFGARAPGPLVAAVLALTTRLPNSWLGLRLAIGLRRIAMTALGDVPLDLSRWGLKLRLYPRGNGCEKNLAFTPQMFEPVERRALAQAIEASTGEFIFVDIGANVGLFSLFVAARAGRRARALAIEPQPGITDRLLFNLRINEGVGVEVLAVAIADHDGEAEFAIDLRDRGGSRLMAVAPWIAAQGGGTPVVRVKCRPLLAVLAERGYQTIDALKIDVEGAEDVALAPFLRGAPDVLLPRLVIIEDSHRGWRIDLFGLFSERGYCVLARSKQNVIFQRDGKARAPAARTRSTPGPDMMQV